MRASLVIKKKKKKDRFFVFLNFLFLVRNEKENVGIFVISWCVSILHNRTKENIRGYL